MSLDSFATGMDYLLERSVGIGMNGVSFGDHSYTDLDFADDVCLLTELLELLVLVLEALAIEAESLGVRGQLSENDDAGFRQHSGCPTFHHSVGARG